MRKLNNLFDMSVGSVTSLPCPEIINDHPTGRPTDATNMKVDRLHFSHYDMSMMSIF